MSILQPNKANRVRLDWLHLSWGHYLKERCKFVAHNAQYELFQNNNAFYIVSPNGDIAIWFGSDGTVAWNDLVKKLGRKI